MAGVAEFDPVAKRITLIDPPVGGMTSLDVQSELYSDAKRHWLTELALNKYAFPFTTIGGNDLGGGVSAGAYYFLDNASGWRIQPYDADQYLTVTGNLFGLDPSLPTFVPTASGFTAVIQLERSSLTQQVSSGSGLSPAQDALLTDIDTKTETMPSDVWQETATDHLTAWTTGLAQFIGQSPAIDTVVTGTPTSTVMTIANGLAVDDYYSDQMVVVFDASGFAQTRPILSYVGATKEITVDEPWAVTPVATNRALVVLSHTHPASQIAQAVWDHTQ